MATAMHTPGPWIANRLEDGDPDTGPDGDYYFDGTFFARRDGGASTEDVSLRNEANARLVAAAPDLLAVVEALAAITDYSIPRSAVASLVMNARTAVRKARRG